jgi:hypothetical protein
MVSLSRGSSSHEPVSQAPSWGDHSPPGLGIRAVGVGLVSGLHYAYVCVCHKTQTRSAPMPSPVPAPRQHVPGITQSIGFLRLRSGQVLGHPSHQSIRPGRLLTPLSPPNRGEGKSRWWVIPSRASIFRDLRPVLSGVEGTALYAASHAWSGYHVPRYYVAEWRQCPLWACLSAV